MTMIEWAALGILLMVLELFLPGTYLIWFGFSALGVAGLVFLWPLSLALQLTAFAVLAMIFALIGLKIYKRLLTPNETNPKYPHLNDAAAALIGQTFSTIEDTKDGRTKIKVGDTVWMAESDNPLKNGTTVVVTGVKDGVILKISEK